VLDRRVFDKVLAARAASAGAEVLTSAPAVGMERCGAGWELTVRKDGSEQNVYGAGVVGADGVESQVGRWAGLDTHTPIRDIESCHQYKLTGVDVDQSVIELVFGLHIAPGGYAWIFPKGDGIVSVGLGIFRSVAREQITAKDYLDRWTEARFPAASRHDAVSGGVIIGTTLSSISTDGLVLVGDAAHQINPLGGAGISSGMRASWLGAGVMAEQIAKGDTSARAMRRYDVLWRRMLGKLHEDHRRLADAILSISDDQFNSLAGLLAGMPDEKRTLYAAISAAIRTRPSMLMRMAGYFRHWRSSGSRSGYPDRPPEYQPPG